MTAGWLLVLVRLTRALIHGTDVYTAVIRPLKLFQTGALLEILHSLTRLIRAPPSTTALQVSSRLMLVWGVANAVAQVRANTSFATMVFAWSLTEIPRYFYFSVAAASSIVPYWLTWIRYTTFLPLYPLGASSEALTLFAALPYIQSSAIFSLHLPNRYNFAFDYYTFCIVTLVMYLPGLPYMYMHMIKQRTKYVNPSPKTVKTQ